MKSNLRSGILCSCLLFLTVPARLGAQGVAPQAPPPVPAAPQQAPAPPQPAPAPPQPQSPSVDLRDTGGDAYSIEPFAWLPKAPPYLRLGLAATQIFTNPNTGQITPGQSIPGNLDFPGTTPYALGVIVTAPTGHENSLEFTAFRLDGKGTTTESTNLILFGNNFTQGDLLNTSYRVQSLKLSWNYLSYPFPSKGAKFRLKTLWEVQYVGVATVVNAPYDVNAIPTVGNKDVIFPTFGLGVEYHPYSSVRLEAKASGFGVPYRADIWDVEGSAVLRLGAIEVFAGGKAYHFKTSPQDNQYFTQTLWGPWAGVRWMFR